MVSLNTAFVLVILALVCIVIYLRIKLGKYNKYPENYFPEWPIVQARHKDIDTKCPIDPETGYRLRNGYVFQGGCLTCTRKYLRECRDCQYFECDWSKPDKNPANKTYEILQDRVRAKA